METENKFGVPYSRRDNGEVKKISKAITRKGTVFLHLMICI